MPKSSKAQRKVPNRQAWWQASVSRRFLVPFILLIGVVGGVVTVVIVNVL